MKDKFIKLVAILLSITMTSSCGKPNRDDFVFYDKYVYEDESDIFKKYSDFYDKYVIVYDNEEGIISKNEVKNYMGVLNDYSYFGCENNSNFDYDRVFETIKFNSMVYLEENRHYYSAFCDEVEDEYFRYKKIFEKVFRDAFDVLGSTSSNNFKEDLCKISGMKVVFSSNKDEITVADYNPSLNVMRIFIDNIIDNTSDFDDEMIYNYMMDVLLHELNHARQVPCDCKLRIGNLVYNVFCVGNFLLESSAESDVYNSGKSFVFEHDISRPYVSERNCESIVMLLGLCNGKSIDEYYNAVFDTNVNALHDFLGIYSDDDIYEYYRAMYAMDGIYGKNSYVESISGDKEVSELEASEYIGCDYANSIFKLCLKNLVNYTKNNPDFSIKDNLGLYYLVRSKILEKSFFRKAVAREIENANGEKVTVVQSGNSYDESFVRDFVNLNKSYVDFLSEYYGYDVKEINSVLDSEEFYYLPMYMSYISDRESFSDDYDVSFLNGLIEKFPMLKCIYFCGYPNPDTYYDMMNESNPILRYTN